MTATDTDEIKDFTMKPPTPTKDFKHNQAVTTSSINAHGTSQVVFDLNEVEDLLKVLKCFEAKAKKVVGVKRQHFRKVEGKKSMIERVREVLEQEE